MQTMAFWSGGKDAALLVHELGESEDELAGLLTTYDETTDRIPYQALSIGGARLQAESIGLELVEVPLPPSAPDDVYVERVLAALESASVDFDTVAFGDLQLSDVRAWRKSMFEPTRFRPVFPLWGRSTRKLARRFLTLGFQAVISTVDTRVLPLDFLGRPFDETLLDDLPDDIDPCGENGEFHTVVWDGPIFASPLQGGLGEVVANGPFVSIEMDLSIPD